jgi:hypothetical protein
MVRTKKIRKLLSIPNELIEMAQLIVSLVENNSVEANIVSDDLIQTEHAFAGRCSSTEQVYGICYFPNANESEDDESEDMDITWSFLFTLEELRRIISHDLTSVNMWTCASGKCNVFAHTQDFYCPICDFGE